MSVLTTLFQDFAARLCSTEFLLDARHADHPTAFSRRRKLPLATLVAIMLTGMRMSIQAELDTFFAHLRQQAQLVHEVSEQAFAQARAKLSLNAIPGLNDWLVARAETDRFVPPWRGLRLVAADASTVRFGLRASHVKRAALADQILFGLFLPGPDLMLAASLHDVHERGERQFLFEHLDRLSPDDLLLLDRGYPCRWLVAVLNDRAIKFCMRVDNTSGFACVRAFMRSTAPEQVVMLPAPNKRDASTTSVRRHRSACAWCAMFRRAANRGCSWPTCLMASSIRPTVLVSSTTSAGASRRHSNGSSTGSIWSM